MAVPLSSNATKAGKGEPALAREGVGMIGMGRVQEKFGRAQARGKINKKESRGTCWPMNKKSFLDQPIFYMSSVFSVYSQI